MYTITEILDRRLEADPDGDYLDVCGTSFTAAEVADRAWRLGAGLRDLGVRPGDRVASLIENSPEAMVLWWATVLTGAIAVPVNTAYKGDYLRHQLIDSGAKVLVVQGDLSARVAAITADLDGLDGLDGLDRLEGLAHVVVTGDPDDDIGGVTTHRWDDLFAADAVRPQVTIFPASLGTFVYTGGTTGPSKGCMLSHNYHEALARQIGICWKRTADDVVWTPLPLFHFNAIVTAILGPLVYGGRGAVSKRFSVSSFWPEINRTGATITSTLGTMAYLLAHDTDRDEMPLAGGPDANTSLRLIGAAPLPVEVHAILKERFGVDTFSGAFGLTECSLVSWQPPGVVNKPNAAGVVNHEFFDVRIFDDDDNEVDTDVAGEIVVRPKRPHVMFEGYWGSPQATLDASTNWWFHTGDIGRIDDDGYLFFVDRKADYLRRRGENISSFEVERILMRRGDLTDVVVHALPSALTEDDLKVTAVRGPDAELTEESLFRWCIEQLPYFALPRYIEFREELPRSPVGRVLKRTLRADGVTPATWDAETAGIAYERR